MPPSALGSLGLAGSPAEHDDGPVGAAVRTIPFPSSTPFTASTARTM